MLLDVFLLSQNLLQNHACKILDYGVVLEFVTDGVELLKAILHGYAGGLIFMK